MSVGNATQAVSFDRRDLTLVLGVNIDLGGDDSGARNGTGKTTIINALSYALYGQALTNIRRDNLINKTNSKGMVVTCEFEHGGLSYRIERGRKPNVLKFFVGNEQQEITDEAQGDSRETQKAIDRMLGMSHEMFKHLVALNTYTQPFLTLKNNDQKDIIEQLLGITMLSEKAANLKDKIKETKSLIKEEEIRIDAQREANEKMTEQIDALKRRQDMWVNKQKQDIEELQSAVDDLLKIDIDQELENHKLYKDWLVQSSEHREVQSAIDQAEREYKREQRAVKTLKADVDKLSDKKCHACGQEIKGGKHQEMLDEKIDKMTDAQEQYDNQHKLYKDLIEAQQTLGTLGTQPELFYEEEKDAYEHKNSISNLKAQLRSRKKETDPYQEQIEEMMASAIVEPSYDTINDLTKMKEHQEFLQKLLTNKDSFIRKRIIDQNLAYLNARLSYYLDKIGLPHTVTFLNDLSVEITELGRELDFDNLSRGERNRLILSLSWSFRDVFESLYAPINLMFIDELIDSGMDASGVESSMSMLKKMSREHHKSVWLVSHKDELSSRVNNIMTVTKENGFTTYGTDVETR